MKHTVLCVDDEVDNVDALERLFRKKYNVLKATSGEEALSLLDKHSVALIVTDQRMPHMTGVEFLAESMKRQPEAMRILLTGYTDIESVIAAVNSGQIYRYVTKPWDPVDLANTVDKAIERYELSAELKKKNEALEAALNELRTLDEAKSNFMILINHELKTPLTSIVSFLSLLRETKLDEEQTKFVRRISQGAQRLQTLIQDSLELISAETGTLPIEIKAVNIKKLFDDLVKSLDAGLRKRKLEIKSDFEVESVRTDAKAFTSILRRLLDNAVKFSLEGSTIEFSTQKEDGQVRITMVNEGSALAPEMLAKILKPFSLAGDIMHHSKGTGLGLSVVQALLHRLGSQLVVDCPNGRFSASFLLPEK